MNQSEAVNIMSFDIIFCIELIKFAIVVCVLVVFSQFFCKKNCQKKKDVRPRNIEILTCSVVRFRRFLKNTLNTSILQTENAKDCR